MSYKNFPRILLFLLAAAAVSGCETIAQRSKIDYKSARKMPALEIPPDLDSLPPDSGYSGTTTYSGYAAEQAVKDPSTQKVLPDYPDVRIERVGDQRWLVVKETPAELWPKLRDFLMGMGLTIARENRTTGIIETEWAENRANLVGVGVVSRFFRSFRPTGSRDKYRLRLERGKEDGTTEIYLTHKGMEEVVSSGGGDQITQTMWQSRSPDPELEAEVMRLLLVYLGVEEAKAKGLLASGIQQVRARLVADNDGNEALHLTDPIEFAWRRVGLALDRLGVKIKERDRSKGLYFIHDRGPGVEEEKKPGFFARMFGRGKKKAVEGRQYKIRLQAADTGTDVQLLDMADRPDTSQGGVKFIRQLFVQLK